MKPIAFIDLKAQQEKIRTRIDQRITAVLDHGKYIMGPEVAELEEALADYTKSPFVVSCSSGTDAIWLPLLALGIGAGDAVFVPSFTFAATAEAVALCGATPVFVDIDADSFNICPKSLEAAIEDIEAKKELTPKAIIAVDLFGLPANYPELQKIADKHNLKLLADAAQSFGGSINGTKVGALTDITTTSFFPAKPLGGYGDGGAMFAKEAEINEALESLRIHGKGKAGKYDNVRVGTNARLDTIQAAILLEKLAIFPEELQKRQYVASRYTEELKDVVATPIIPEGYESAWAQYTIKTNDREALIGYLAEKNIPTQVYYPKPMHQQEPYQGFPCTPTGMKVTESLALQVLSLPMHPYLEPETQNYIIEHIRAFFEQQKRASA